ncbi:MAG: hypothetical protein RIR51_906 [Bacteroidota bacterium]
METENHFVIRLAAGLISISLILLGLYWFKDLFILLGFALILSLLLFPLCVKFENWGLPRSLGIIIGILLALTFFFLIIFIMINQLDQLSSKWPLFVEKFNVILQEGQKYLSDKLRIPEQNQALQLSNSTVDVIKSSGSILSETFGTALRTITSVILTPIFIFFLLYYRDFIAEFLSKLFPKAGTDQIHDILGKTAKVAQGYLLGLASVMIFAAILNTFGFWLLGVDFYLFFGILTGLLLLIPYVGIWLAALGPIVLSLVESGPSSMFGVIIWVAAVQFIEANFVTPMVVGSRVSINPLLAILALTIGEIVWGIPGLILALPFTAMLKVVFDYVPELKPYGFLLGIVPKRPKK